jgi:hypothetical protein
MFMFLLGRKPYLYLKKKEKKKKGKFDRQSITHSSAVEVVKESEKEKPKEGKINISNNPFTIASTAQISHSIKQVKLARSKSKVN